MATVACELHSAFAYFHWTGFYRAAVPTPAAAQQGEHAEQQQRQPERQLVIGPYQGGLGCLRILFSKGVCGAAARERRTQLVPDVHAFPGHIACASSTQVGCCACRHVCIWQSGHRTGDTRWSAHAPFKEVSRWLDVAIAQPGILQPPHPSAFHLQSEVVVPVLTPDGQLLAVLDVDSGGMRRLVVLLGGLIEQLDLPSPPLHLLPSLPAPANVAHTCHRALSLLLQTCQRPSPRWMRSGWSVSAPTWGPASGKRGCNNAAGKDAAGRFVQLPWECCRHCRLCCSASLTGQNR